jgi:hypothetical protein
LNPTIAVFRDDLRGVRSASKFSALHQLAKCRRQFTAGEVRRLDVAVLGNDPSDSPAAVCDINLASFCGFAE